MAEVQLPPALKSMRAGGNWEKRNQKSIRKASCMVLGPPKLPLLGVPLSCPNAEAVCGLPAPCEVAFAKVAVLFNALNCVWLNVL